MIVANGLRVSQPRVYFTAFDSTENPLRENGAWRAGLTDGLNWTDVRKTPGRAFGTQSGTTGPPYDDSVATLTGPWTPNQTVYATVYQTNPNSTAFEEVELWVRATILPNFISGYEVNFRAIASGSQYCGIVRWNGPLGDFTQIEPNVNFPTNPGLVTGDVVKVTIMGNLITAYINGVSISSHDISGDAPNSQGVSKFTGGSPGMGHWFRTNGAGGLSPSDYGFTRFTAIG